MGVELSVSTDTRSIKKDDLFFALKGPSFDAHDFLKEAVEKGASRLVISEESKIPPGLRQKAQFIVVEDTLKAYGDWAAQHRATFKIPTIAITGSSGKTTVKELTAHLLSADLSVLKNQGTENNLVGVPKTIFGLKSDHQVLVLEMGTNQPGEIDRLASLAQPEIGILTQIGYSHLQGLKDLAGVRAEKLSLLRHLKPGGVLIVNGEDPMLADVSYPQGRVIRVGFSKEKNEVVADALVLDATGTSFVLNGEENFKTRLYGRHNVLNCLLAITAAKELGITVSSLRKSLETFQSVPGRLEFRNVDGLCFLNDSYNANPTSFKAALETLREFKSEGKRGVVCGDMLELGTEAETLHRQAGNFLAGCGLDWVIAAGPLCKYLVEGALESGLDPKKIHHVKDSREAGVLCRQLAVPGDTVLIKGSRGMKMEKVFECFTTFYTR